MQYWTIDMEKQVGFRLQNLLDSPQLLSVYRQFGGQPFRRSSVFHGLEGFLRENNIAGRRCFEIGTWNGLTAVVLSQFFAEVVTVDIAHNELKHEIIKHLGITNIRCVEIDSNEDKARVFADTKFDLAYLDGNHAQDTGGDWKLTKGCGRVLFHEAWPFQKPVWDLLHSLPEDEVVWGGDGLALWRRQT